MKILTAAQTQELDRYTIQHEPIASIDLMERASLTFAEWFTTLFPDPDRQVKVFCGIGNNGGDGLAVARLLHQRLYDVTVFLCRISEKTTDDFAANLGRLPRHNGVTVKEIHRGDPFPGMKKSDILIDAVFGSGLNRPVEGYWGDLIRHLNKQPCLRVSIDVPSGLFADQLSTGVSLEANYTLSFEMPKLAFLFPENQDAVGQWEYRSIGLSREFLDKVKTPYHYLDREMLSPLLRQRRKFAHKGTFGHALLIMGSYGKMGAAVLAARACLRSGPGLVSVHLPECGYQIMQNSVPEAMVSIDPHPHVFSQLPDLSVYQAIGIGCGLDRKAESARALLELIEQHSAPMVIDADALNLLAEHKSYLQRLPPGSILTPHPKEFERLFGATGDSFARNELQREKAVSLGLHIVLKGAHTCVAAPDGQCFFNSSGNPGMATGGSGDVLTGVITGLLAQGYPPLHAALLGVYLHGRAGDLAALGWGPEAIIAGDITRHLGKAFLELRTPGKR